MTVLDTAWLCPVRARLRTAITVLSVTLVALGASSLTASAALARGRGCRAAHARIARTSRRVVQRAVVCLLNRQRRAHGLPALHQSGELDRSAQGWTNAMVFAAGFTHGSDFAARISAVGFRWSSVGENIATGYATPAAVVRAWMASTGHCQNILNPTFRDVGAGFDDRRILGFRSLPGTWTTDFGLPIGQGAASGNWGPARGCPYRA
jgi:uncharacterized protein YkwD